MTEKPKNIEATFNKILNSSVSVGMICLTLVVIYNALLRFLPIASSQMAWTEEIGRLLVLWLAFVGAGVITREEKHFVIDLVIDAMGPRLRLFCKIFCDLLMIAFLIILGWETVPVVIDQMGQVSSGGVEMPLGIFSLSLLVGILIMIFYVIRNSVNHFRKFLPETGRKDGRNG